MIRDEAKKKLEAYEVCEDVAVVRLLFGKVKGKNVYEKVS